MACPVRRAEPGPPRNTTSEARSSGSATPRWASEAAFSKRFLLKPSRSTWPAVGVPAISDGVMTFTLIPLRLASMAVTRENMTMAAMAPPSTLSPGVATLAASEAILMTGEPGPGDAPGGGYSDIPAETAATIDAGGWLHMGDIGSMDERGFLRVTSRVKDMIIRGGMNLYPAEIEAVLQDHPAVETAAVIGVPDEKWGDQVAAVLRVRADFARPTAAELTQFLRDQIAPHKIPVFWSFVDGLPMTPTGKTQKFVLRQQVTDGTLTFDEIRPSKSASQL